MFLTCSLRESYTPLSKSLSYPKIQWSLGARITPTRTRSYWYFWFWRGKYLIRWSGDQSCNTCRGNFSPSNWKKFAGYATPHKLVVTSDGANLTCPITHFRLLMPLEMPVLNDLVASINPLINWCVFASDFGVLNHLRRHQINVNSTICAIMLNKKMRQVGSLVMKFL